MFETFNYHVIITPSPYSTCSSQLWQRPRPSKREISCFCVTKSSSAALHAMPAFVSIFQVTVKGLNLLVILSYPTPPPDRPHTPVCLEYCCHKFHCIGNKLNTFLCMCHLHRNFCEKGQLFIVYCTAKV